MFRLLSAVKVLFRNMGFYAQSLQTLLKGYEGLLDQGFCSGFEVIRYMLLVKGYTLKAYLNFGKVIL